MKKLLSIVLTIAMLATMLSVPMVAGAKAYTAIDLNSGFVADTTFGNGNMKETAAYGVAGKDASDESMMLTENANAWTSWYSYNHGEEIYLENGQPMTGYLVMELNFMIPSTSKFSSWFFGLSTNQARLSEDVTEKAGLKRDQWNHIRLVYWADETNCDFKDYADNIPTSTTDKLGASETYLNGVKIGNTKQLKSATNSSGSAYTAKIDTILFELYTADKDVQHSAYYDDLKIYKSATNPGAQANAALTATSEYTVSGNVVSLASGASLTPAEIAAANSGYTITAFEDASLSSQLSNDTVLAIDNAVVAKSPAGVYTYYTVQDASTKILYTATEGVFSETVKLKQSIVNGYGGKEAKDAVALINTNTPKYQGGDYDGNIMVTKTHTLSKKYLVMEANINPVAGDTYMTSVSIHTSSHGSVASGVGLPLGQWSKYVMYVDVAAKKSYVYLNGKLEKETTANSKLFDSGASLRFCFNGKTETVDGVAQQRPFSLYLDDMKWYETDSKPDGIAKSALPAPASSTYYSVDGDKIKALPTTTVANIKGANSGNKVRVYTDAAMTKIADDAALATSGMKVVVENGYKALKAYTVAVSYGEKELDLRKCDGTDKTKLTVANGSGTNVGGIGGKDSSDTALSVTVTSSGNGDTFVGLNSWGTVVKTGADNSVIPSWDKTNYNGYFVVEFSVFNISNTNISMVTTQSAQVSANIASLIPKNQWARVKFVYNAVDGDAYEGKTQAYVNGVAAGGWTNSSFGTMAAYATNNYMSNDVRLSIKGGTKDQISSYVDDVRMYEIPALRPEQAIDFVAPGACGATDTAFGIVDGDTVTVGDVKAANPGLDIKFFDNKTNYTAITSDSATLVEGNVIFVNVQSQSAIDAGIAYKDLFKVMTVENTPATKDFVTGIPASFVRGEFTSVTDGVYGNKSSTIKKLVNNGAENNCYGAHPHKGFAAGMNYLVWEADFAPAKDTSYIYLAANQNAGLSGPANVGDNKELKANQWHKIVAVYDMNTDLCDLYVNGKLVSEDFKGSYSTKAAANDGTVDVRVIVSGTGKTAFESYFDNYRIYESVFYPSIAAPATLSAGYNAAVKGFVDNTSMIATVKSGTSADITAAGYDVSVIDSNYAPVTGTIAEGNIILAKKNGNFAYYKTAILADNDIVVLGDTYDANKGIMTPGAVSAYGVTDNGGVVIVAQYDEKNNLIKVKASDDAVNGIVTLDFDADDIDDTVIKAYLFNNFDQIAPLCANKEIKHTRNYNLLMLGNSFSMDVTCYMEEIAAAQGKNFNIHVLNKGGSAVSYHYENREMDLKLSDLNHFKNDVHVGKSNLKTLLETYDYDYVVIQNWGSSVGFYANTDANYNSNWATIPKLAKYINEREPNAEIMLHETWAFETGYNGWTQDAADSIRAVYDRAASEAAAAIGQSEPLRKISSLSAFNAAKAYEDGALFETTYYKDGHLFSGYDNRATVPVGDGSSLLSPEDAAAGKVSLHRDGFHASQVGRYLIALNAVQFLTGKSVYGNTYRPGTISLDSSAYYGGNEVTDLDNASSGVIYQKYDPIAESVVNAVQTIVEGMR